MISTEVLFKEKKFPDWFQNHPVFNEIKQVSKIFPKIGLPNCQEDIEVDNKRNASKYARSLLNAIEKKFLLKLTALKKMKGAAKNIDECKQILTQLTKLIAKNKEGFIQDNNGRYSLKLTKDILLDKKPVLREGESLFRVYNKINEVLKKLKITELLKLENITQFKTFSSQNIPKTKMKVVFSSDGVDGVWDIATMSMRGISSCQSWSGDYKHCTIGSVLDPFVGILYFTSGAKFNSHGSKMIRRALVRFAINEETNRPILIIDYMYPSNDTKVLKVFKEFLINKTSGKIDVHCVSDKSYNEKANKFYLPLNSIRKTLLTYNRDSKNNNQYYDKRETIASYQDYAIKDKEKEAKAELALFFKNSSKKMRKLNSYFVTSFTKTFRDNLGKQLIDLPENKLTSINNHLEYISKAISDVLISEVEKSVDINNFFNSSTYIRRVYYNYFNNSVTIIDKNLSLILEKVNAYLYDRRNRLTKLQLKAIFKTILPGVNTELKTQLKKIVDKRKFSGALPLPA